MKTNIKKKGKRSISIFTVLIWLSLIAVMTVITVTGIKDKNAVEGETYTLTFNSGEGLFEDGTTTKTLTVTSDTKVTMDYLKENGIVAKNGDEEVAVWYRNGWNYINNSNETYIYGSRTFEAKYGKKKVDFKVFTYDGNTLSEEIVDTKYIPYYNNITELPKLAEKEGYTLIKWRSGYTEDDYGINLLPYGKAEYKLIEEDTAVYAMYFKNGSGKLSEVYIDGTTEIGAFGEDKGYSNRDSSSGKTPEEAVYSFTRAKQLLAENGTIYVVNTVNVNSFKSDSDINLSLEGYGNAKVQRYKEFGNYLFNIDNGANATFTNITIDGGSDIGLKGDRGLICVSGNLTLGEGAVLQNSTVKYELLYATDDQNTEVDGGAALLAKLGGNIILEDGSVIRNNTVELNGDKSSWLAKTTFVEITDVADIKYIEESDYTYKYTLSGAKNLEVNFGGGAYSNNLVLYDKDFNIIYMECVFTEADNLYFSSAKAYVPGDTVYIRFVCEDRDTAIFEDLINDINITISEYTEDIDINYDYRRGILGGGAIALDNTGSTMIMNGGEIYGNSSYWGGAIYCGPQNQLTINGGKIHDNDASYGGAIYIEEHGYTYEATEEGLIQTEKNYNTVDTIINGGEIYNNTAEVDGGGVYVESSTFKLNGGNIYSNTAGNQGGGVYVGNGYTAQNDITTTFEMMGGNIYSNIAYVGGGIYNAGTCALKAGNIYDNKVTKENEATGSTYASYKNYGGSAVYAYEDVIMYPEIRINGDVRVCVDEGANIVLPKGFEGYSEYNNPSKTTIEVSVEEYLAHEDYAIVRADNSKENNVLTEEQVNSPEKAILSETGRSEDNRVAKDKVIAKKSIFATIEEIVKRIAEIFKNEYKLTENDLAKFEYYGDYGWRVKLDKGTNQLELTKIKEITKIWNDDNDSEGIRPDSVKLEIYKDGQEYDKVTVSKKDNWTYKLYETGRSDYDEEEPVFTIIEKDLPEDYIAKVVEKTDGNIEVQNTLVDISKTVKVGDGAYVKVGEELEYTLTYKNNNPYGEMVTITDRIPKGTKYVANSMNVKINSKDAKDKFEMTESTTGELVWKTKDGEVLASGEKVAVSFKVKVLSVEEGLNIDKITNKGKVIHGETVDTQKEDETNEVENTVENDPIKELSVGNGKEVKTGEELTYVVTYNNLEEGKVKVTDSIPEGTKYVEGSMKVEINGKNAKDTFDIIELSNGATNGELVWETKEGKTVPESSVVTVSFKVKVLNVEEGLNVDKITNKAKVTHEGTISGITTKDTNEVENKVVIEEVDTSDINVGRYVAISLIAIVGIALVVVIIAKSNKKKKINN